MPTVSELKNELKARGLSTHGNKAELEVRLRDATKSGTNSNNLQPREQSSPSKRPTAAGSSPGSKRLKTVHGTGGADALFDSLSGGEDNLDPEKTLAFCEKLGIDPEAPVAIGLSYYLKSPAMGSFNRQGFVTGCKELRVASLEELKAALPVIEKKSSFGGSDFDQVYKFVFSWGCEPGIRNLKKDVAISLWQLLIPKNGFALIQDWIQHWEESNARVVTKDEWVSFKRYVDLMKTSTRGIDSDDAWPIAIDEFVDKLKKKNSQQS